MTSILSTTAQNTCMICLGALLVPNAEIPRNNDEFSIHDDDNDDDDEEENPRDKDIGGVFPCGHVFHVYCFHEWSQQTSQRPHPRCPNCNQDASLFCKLFLSAPCLPPPPPPPPPPIPVPTHKPAESDQDDDEDDTIHNDNNDDEEKEQRRLLLDLRSATQAGPAQAIRKVVSLRSKVRKLKREGRSTRDELDSTRVVLQITQEELQLANEAMEGQSTKFYQLQDKLNRIQTQHWQRHKILHEELLKQQGHQVQSLERELAQVKMELALRNRQLKHWVGAVVDHPNPVVLPVTSRIGDSTANVVLRRNHHLEPKFQHA